ncbi:FtsX-like permease family protein [Paenibacillus sp. MBLB4367]|uniref:FtsX-like permease family protein n=1 Tax=Paenibacillus sp. MBLB4367 TaxID=3384767 RepID=UPI0039082740
MLLYKLLMRKMWNTRWLTLSALAGLILAVSFTTSIPMYAGGSLKHAAAETLAAETNGLPAGSLLIGYQASGSEKPASGAIAAVSQYVTEQLPGQIGVPVDAYFAGMSLKKAQLSPADPAAAGSGGKVRQLELTAQPGLTELIDIVKGKAPAEQVRDGVIEAMVYQETLYRYDLTVGETYKHTVQDSNGGSVTLSVRIVGAFQPKNPSDLAWFKGLDALTSALIVSERVFEAELTGSRKLPVQNASWYYAFDLRNIEAGDLPGLIAALERLDTELFRLLKQTKVNLTFLELLQKLHKQNVQLQMLLFSLAAPVLGMIVYYIVMIAKQSLGRQQAEIAVLRSRGASARQIVALYLLEGALLGFLALLAGPLLGWLMAKALGSSNGFLAFALRKSVAVDVSADALLYGLAAVFVSVFAVVIPAAAYARATIVSYNRKKARSDRSPLWMRWFLDVALLVLTVAGWYGFQSRQWLTLSTGISQDQLQASPLLFFVPALAIFALGLFALRLFPWLLRLLGKLGKRILPVPLYLTLTQLSRSAALYYPLMLLLVLTLGLGVYNASAARTIDLNSVERALYRFGAEVVMQPEWEGTQDQSQPDGKQSNKIFYDEPPFESFRSLEGVEAAARVLNTTGKATIAGKAAGQVSVMGIDNTDFARVAWYRSELYDYHPFQYLDLLGSYEQAALVSSSFADKYQLKPGDPFTVTLGQDNAPVEFVVAGVIPYWPALYPDERPFAIANLDYIHSQIELVPYEVWFDMKPGAKVAPMLEQLAAKQIGVSAVKDVRNELIDQKNMPTQGGVFGILSMGFLVSAAVSLLGYIMYWFFTLSGRVVQFGVLRAMGLTRRQLTGMLLLEQCFTAGLSIAIGIGIGKLTSMLFLPFLQTSGEAAKQVPPFRIVFEARDTVQLYAVVSVMALAGAVMLLAHIRRLRVHEALKM